MRWTGATGIAIHEATLVPRRQSTTPRPTASTLLDPHLVPEGYGPTSSASRPPSRRPAAELPSSGRRRSRVRRRLAHPTRVAARSQWRLGAGLPGVGPGGERRLHRRPALADEGGGPRCRAFLHSYEPAADPDGAALETILTAPLIVAQWINCQYLLLGRRPGGLRRRHQDDPQRGRRSIGVLAGPRRPATGLPWQSLADGERLVHEPMRLLAWCRRRSSGSTESSTATPSCSQLFGNEWVALAARSRAGERWLAHTTRGWEP